MNLCKFIKCIPIQINKTIYICDADFRYNNYSSQFAMRSSIIFSAPYPSNFSNPVLRLFTPTICFFTCFPFWWDRGPIVVYPCQWVTHSLRNETDGGNGDVLERRADLGQEDGKSRWKACQEGIVDASTDYPNLKKREICHRFLFIGPWVLVIITVFRRDIHSTQPSPTTLFAQCKQCQQCQQC